MESQVEPGTKDATGVKAAECCGTEEKAVCCAQSEKGACCGTESRTADTRQAKKTGCGCR